VATGTDPAKEPKGWFPRTVAALKAIADVLTPIGAILGAVVVIGGTVGGIFLTRGGGSNGSSTTSPGSGPTSVATGPAPATSTSSNGKKIYLELQGTLGARTFNEPGEGGEGDPVEPNAKVWVSCKKYAPVIQSVSPDGYWYRLASPPWNDHYYVAANTFLNGGTYHGAGVINTDRHVADC
jgi:hypothetical protein